MDRHCTTWQIAWQILFSSVFCTLIKHALPTNDSGCYIWTLLPNSLQHSSAETLLEEPNRTVPRYWTTLESKDGAGVSYLILIAHVVKTCIIKHYLCRYQVHLCIFCNNKKIGKWSKGLAVEIQINVDRGFCERKYGPRETSTCSGDVHQVVYSFCISSLYVTHTNDNFPWIWSRHVLYFKLR